MLLLTTISFEMKLMVVNAFVIEHDNDGFNGLDYEAE